MPAGYPPQSARHPIRGHATGAGLTSLATIQRLEGRQAALRGETDREFLLGGRNGIGHRLENVPPNRPKALLKPESFSHQPLQAGLVEEIEGEFFFGEHGEGCALGSGGEFGGFFHGKARVLADHRQDHAHHQLQATDFAGLFFFFLGSVVRSVAGFFFGEREVSIAAGVARYLHVAPFAQVLLIQLR
jgi:hypothetical protein